MTNPREQATNDQLSLFLTGFASGIGSFLASQGIPPEIVEHIARGSTAQMQHSIMLDPAVRNTVLAAIEAALGGEEGPMTILSSPRPEDLN